MTRRSTLGFTAATLGGFLVASVAVGGGGDAGTGVGAVVLALALGVWLVCGATAWVSGLVLANRARSLLWLLVVVALGPIGAAGCALFCPNPRANPR